MAAITSLSDFIAKATGSVVDPEVIFKFIHARVSGAAATAPTAGRFTTLWRYETSRGGAGALPPTTAANPDNTTPGGMFQTNPTGGREKFLTFLSVAGLNQGGILLYDRLLHKSGISGIVTTPQTVGGTLSRNTSGEGNTIWVEIHTAIGTTGSVITASYTNQDGVAGRTTQGIAIGGTGLNGAQRAFMLPLQQGDTGVRSVEEVDLTLSTGTAGDMAVVIARPIVWIGGAIIGAGAEFSALLKGRGPIAIPDDACLAMMWLPSTSTAPEMLVTAYFVES